MICHPQRAPCPSGQTNPCRPGSSGEARAPPSRLAWPDLLERMMTAHASYFTATDFRRLRHADVRGKTTAGMEDAAGGTIIDARHDPRNGRQPLSIGCA